MCLRAAVPNFLAPGTSFVDDTFSTDWGGVGGSLGGNASDGERQMKLRSPAAHLLLCGLVPNRPRTGKIGRAHV